MRKERSEEKKVRVVKRQRVERERGKNEEETGDEKDDEERSVSGRYILDLRRKEECIFKYTQSG